MAFEYKDLIGLYGALVSSILAFFAIKAKISMLKFGYQTDWAFNSEFKREEPYITITIVNASEKDIIIKKIIIECFKSHIEIYR